MGNNIFKNLFLENGGVLGSNILNPKSTFKTESENIYIDC